VVAIATTIAVHSANLRLYFDPQSSTVRLGLLTPVLSVIALHQSLGLPLGEMEAVFGRELRRLRALHVLAALAVLAVGALVYVAVHGATDAVGQSVRNTAILVGLLLATSTVTGPDAAWVVPVGVVLATYGFGVDYDGGRPRGWAVLFHAPAPPDVLAGVGFLAIAALLFVVRGPRGARLGDGGQ
jgi:hypothetical protein